MRIRTTLAVLALTSIGLVGTAGTAAADAGSNQNTGVLAVLLCDEGGQALALPLSQTACTVFPRNQSRANSDAADSSVRSGEDPQHSTRT